MTKDEWIHKITSWCNEDDALRKLPFIFYEPIAKHLADFEKANGGLTDNCHYCDECGAPEYHKEWCSSYPSSQE